jgi:hypothetical protein
LPWLRVLQVTQCARSFGEGAGGEPVFEHEGPLPHPPQDQPQ